MTAKVGPKKVIAQIQNIKSSWLWDVRKLVDYVEQCKL